jgi:AraC-like DNA-binding protein
MRQNPTSFRERPIFMPAPQPQLDPLSDVLSLLKPHTYKAGGFDVGGDFSIHFPDHPGIKCYAVTSGEGWLAFDDGSETIRVACGDCFVLPTGRGFRLTTNLALPSRDYLDILKSLQAQGALQGGMQIINGGGACSIVGGHFVLGGNHARVLLEALPPIVYLQKESDREVLRWAMERMRQELREDRPGGALVSQHLAHMMFVQALRLHIEQGSEHRVGWLAALADKQMAAAINAMHQDPAHHWTLEELAAKAGMSRSSFAAKFKAKVAVSPMEYLTRWRMLLAGDRLTNTADSIAEVAITLGYESESSFSTAFKRVMACSPRQYAREQSAPNAVAAGSPPMAQSSTTLSAVA